MKIRIPTRTGAVTAEGHPLACLRVLKAALPLVFASEQRARRIVQEITRNAEQQGLSVRRWRTGHEPGCLGADGHAGPCAARPDLLWASPQGVTWCLEHRPQTLETFQTSPADFASETGEDTLVCEHCGRVLYGVRDATGGGAPGA